MWPLIILVLALALILIAGWWFDRSRAREGRAPYVDRRPYRPDFHGESTEFGHDPPAKYIDPTGGGPPPGRGSGRRSSTASLTGGGKGCLSYARRGGRYARMGTGSRRLGDI